MSERGYEVRQKIRPAMLALRDAEDWARLELRDEVLASRFREVHEELTVRVINGKRGRGLSRPQLEQALWYFERIVLYTEPPA